MRVLLIGINYAPEETGIAPYSTAMAEHFASLGHDVDVLTGLPHYPAWKVERDNLRSFESRKQAESVRLHRRWHYVPKRQSAFQRGLYEGSFLLSGLLGLRTKRPDVIVGVVPSLSGGILARAASIRFQAPYGLIFQDLMSKAAQQSGVPGARRVAGLVRRAERWISAEASAVGVIAKGFSSYVESLGVDPAKLYHVPNWTHIEPATQSAAATQQRFGLPQDKIICLHAGNMGFKQGLENVIECARLAQQTNEQKLLFVMLGDGSRRAELLELTARYGLSNVRFLPIQPADSFANLLGAADVLLLNQMANVVDMSLPGKLTCYFFAERPVVAAVNSRSETAREIVDSGGGIVVNPEEPALLLEAICELASDPNRRLQLGRTGAAYARNNLTAGMSLRRCSEFLNLIARPALAGNVATEGVSYLANPN